MVPRHFHSMDFFIPVIQIGSDFGFPRQYGMLIHAGLWLIHIFSTVFVLPRFKVINPAEAERLQSSVAVTVYTIPIKTMAPPEQPKDPEKMATQCLGQEAKVRPKGRNAVSFRASACTLIFLSSVYWFGVIDLRNLYFGSSFNAWTTHVMRGDLSRGKRFQSRIIFVMFVLMFCCHCRLQLVLLAYLSLKQWRI